MKCPHTHTAENHVDDPRFDFQADSVVYTSYVLETCLNPLCLAWRYSGEDWQEEYDIEEGADEHPED